MTRPAPPGKSKSPGGRPIVVVAVGLLAVAVAVAAARWGLPAKQDTPSPERWQWIVVHHSASDSGSAAVFDQWHRERGWKSLGYDFVIGNGAGSGDGQVEVGPRWEAQEEGAHTLTPSNRFNQHGIGICLVGDFSKPGHRPTRAQWAALVELCARLCREHDIAPDRILGHRDAQATEGRMTTECPGNLDLDALRRQVADRLR
ncbi:MAG: hypothetical protein BIFFINMI_01926 [Phycisphaerae bacterium]|nr:hypothetical protein [Phycisphaerae bacterium]